MSNNQYDEFYSMGKGVLKYPALFITEYDEQALPVLLDGLFSDAGDLPVLLDYKGKLTKLGSVSKTPKQILKFIRVTRISIIVGPDDIRPVRTIEELLDMEDFSWTR